MLRNISGMIRQRIRLQQHVKAKTAEGRFTGYILVAFPAVMFLIAYVLNPGYAGILVHTNMGLTLLGVSLRPLRHGRTARHPEDHHGQGVSRGSGVVSWSSWAPSS